ncbi:thioredoxin family protein [Sulfuriferula thiophila]|uniref:thioredoxin family protein n=1 Tax=Sulfuriferula thiophila TaxID=1781211 RepID=UPI000F606A0B|nr:thioredoxin family protein [Sulfuriferula thiophila]
MSTVPHYAETQPTRAEIDQLTGLVALEFGVDWCGHCQAALPLLAAALAAHPQIRHIKVEDGKGRRLGRSFGVKLWPTLILLKNGVEITRLVRPVDMGLITEALDRITD